MKGKIPSKSTGCSMPFRNPIGRYFSLRVLGELGFSEIGRLFGKTANWACVTYHRAKEKIRVGMTDTEKQQKRRR